MVPFQPSAYCTARKRKRCIQRYNAENPGGCIMKRLLALLVLLVTVSVLALAQTRGGTAACDRECLRGFITQYLDAMIAHDPKKLVTAPNVRFTEDTKTIPLGEGLWKGASKIRSY